MVILYTKSLFTKLFFAISLVAFCISSQSNAAVRSEDVEAQAEAQKQQARERGAAPAKAVRSACSSICARASSMVARLNPFAARKKIVVQTPAPTPAGEVKTPVAAANIYQMSLTQGNAAMSPTGTEVCHTLVNAAFYLLAFGTFIAVLDPWLNRAMYFLPYLLGCFCEYQEEYVIKSFAESPVLAVDLAEHKRQLASLATKGLIAGVAIGALLAPIGGVSVAVGAVVGGLGAKFIQTAGRCAGRFASLVYAKRAA